MQDRENPRQQSETEQDTAEAEPRQDKDKLVHTKSLRLTRKSSLQNYVTVGTLSELRQNHTEIAGKDL